MVQCNCKTEQSVILCTYENLIKAIWGNNFSHSSNEINRLAWSIRKKIETDSGEPQFLLTVPGQGYKFVTKVIQ
jgi:DNA-binding response OmpR family regulator